MMANVITGIRILVSAALLLCPVFSLIFFVKIINIISGYAMHKRFIAVHTTMNKVTGVLLFIVPLTLSIVPLIYTGIPICSVATFAAVQEGHFIRK